MPTEKKRLLVGQLRERLSRSNMVVLTDYRGLDMVAITDLRRNVERAGGGYHVVKNTLFLLALKDAGVDGLEPYLDGPTAVAFAYEDAPSVAKALGDYAKDSPFFKIKAGWMQGEVLSSAEVRTLASVPPRPILLGQLAGTLQSPIARLAGSLSAAVQQLLYALKARAEELGPAESEAEAEAAAPAA